MSESESQAIITGEALRDFNLQQPVIDIVDNVMTLHAHGQEIRVRRTLEDTQHPWIRLLNRDTNGLESITPWVRVQQGANLVIGGMTNSPAAAWILVEGAESPLLQQTHLP